MSQKETYRFVCFEGCTLCDGSWESDLGINKDEFKGVFFWEKWFEGVGEDWFRWILEWNLCCSF